MSSSLRRRGLRWLGGLTAASVVSTLALVGIATVPASASDQSDGMSVSVSPDSLIQGVGPSQFTLSVSDANTSGATFSNYLLAGVPADWTVTDGGSTLSPVSPDPVIYSLPKADAQTGKIAIVPAAGYTGKLTGLGLSRESKSQNLVTDFDNGTFDYLGQAKPQLPAANTNYQWDDPTIIGNTCSQYSNQGMYGPDDGCYTIWPTANIGGPDVSGLHFNNRWADLRSVSSPMSLTDVPSGPFCAADNTYQVSDADSAKSGKILVVNGSVNMPVPNNLVQTTITGLQPNTYYSFSGYIANLSYWSNVKPVQSAFFADNGSGEQLIGSSAPSPIQAGCANDQTTWTEATSLVNTGDATSLTIGVRNYAGGGKGNDLGIDNLALYPMAHASFDLQVDPATPKLSITKDDGKTIVRPGEQTTYTITVSNSGTGVATGVTVSDVLPAELSYVSSTAGGSYDPASRTVTWNLGDVPAGGTATATITAKVNADVKPDTQITNVATITSPNCTVDCDGTDIDKTPAKVSIVKDDHKTVVSAGESTTYDLTVSNDSPDQEATGVVVTDVLPAELEYLSSTDSGSYDQNTRTVTWNVGTLAAGASKTVHVTAKVGASVAPDTDITNIARVTTDNGCDQDCESTDVDRTPPAVSILKDDHKSIVKPGEELTYDITASNLSSKQSANGVVVTDVLPAELTYKSATNGGSYDSASRTVTWNLGTLAPSEAKTVQLTVVVDKSVKPDTSIANTATVTTDKGCLNPAGCDSTDTDKTPASVSIVKDDHKTVVKPGDDTTYDLVVANASKDQDATGVVVTDTLPAELEYKSSTDSGAYDPATRTVTWNLGTLKAGASKTIQVTATVNAATGPDATITNTAKVDTDQGCVVEDECNTTDVDRTPPAVSIVKDDHKTILKPGESTTYDLTVTNKSADQIAKSVVVTDTLPKELAYDSATDGGVYDPDTHTVTWTLGDIVAGGQRVLQVTGVLSTSIPTDADVTNLASVDTEDGCLVKADCESTDTDTTPPAVSIVKDDHKTVVGLGEDLTYDLVVTNKSEKQDATGVVVTDTLPSQLTYVSASDEGVYEPNDGTVTWNLGTLAKGESRTVQVTATVSKETPAGADITNTAKVDTEQGCVVDADCTTTDVDHTPNVSIVKDDHKTVVYPGQSLTYDLTVTNNADWAATGVTAVDTLPAKLTYVSATDAGKYDPATRTVIWNLGELAGHQAKTVQVTATVATDVQKDEELVNLASVTTDQGCIGNGCSTQDKDLLDPPAAILAETGSTIFAIGIWVALGAGLVGAALLLIRRRRAQED